MQASDPVVASQMGRMVADLIPAPANDPDPFDGSGAGDWGEQWMDRRLQTMFQADEQAQPSPRLAELMRRLEFSLERDTPR